MSVGKGWPAVVVGGVAMGVLASLPALDAVLWRLTSRVLPWALAVVLVAAVVLAARWLWRKGQRG